MVENFLRNRGFVLPKVRYLLRNQIYLALFGLVFSIILLPASWSIGFAVGAILGTFNFYFIAKLAQELIYMQRGALAPLLFSFYVRLFLTGLVLYVAIVFWGANVFALLIGLSIILVNVLIFGAALVGQKLKEA